MTAPSNEGYDAAHINKILANHLASNDRGFFIVEMCVKFFPIILSSLIAVYSIITTSIFYDTNQVANLSFYILMASVLVFVLSIYIMLLLNKNMLVELRISKKIIEHSRPSDEYTVQYLYKPIYDDSIVRSIRKTASELSSTAFVILFPGGIADIVLGFASNDPQIGINSTGQIITGIVFLAFSMLLLLHSIRVEQRNLKKSKAKETDTMRIIIEKVQEVPLKTEEIRVIFNENGPSLLYS
jgi:hypothetical protein